MQPYVEWRESFSVGNEELDAQHKAMFKLLNSLHDALEEGESQQSIEEMIEEACHYAERHFATEEFLMARCGYPRLAEHKQWHEVYVSRIGQIRRKAKDAKEDVPLELFLYLKEWWSNHLTQLDKMYAPYLRKDPAK